MINLNHYETKVFVLFPYFFNRYLMDLFFHWKGAYKWTIQWYDSLSSTGSKAFHVVCQNSEVFISLGFTFLPQLAMLEMQ